MLSPRRGVSGQAGRLSVVRNFLASLCAFLAETEVPPHGLLSGPNRRKPYLFSTDEIRCMLPATMELGPRNSLRPYTYNALLGLLVSTGLQAQIRHSNGNVRVVPGALDDDIPATVDAGLLLGGHKSIASLSGVRFSRPHPSLTIHTL
jgi:hypothetical protein